MGNVKQRVGQKIREARLEKGLTQKELAERLGVVKSVISEYEKGNQNLTIETLDKVASVLGLSFTIGKE
jgi:repressor LexA